MESSKVFAKKSKKIQNCRKAQNCSQKCPDLFWTCFVAFFFEKKLPRVPWSVGFWKIWKKNQNIFKIPKLTKSFSKVSKRVLNMLWGVFSEFFCRVFHAGLFRFSRLKNMRSVFWTWKIWIRFSGLKIWGRYTEQIQQKNEKKFKVLKLSKSFPSVLTCFGAFFGKKSFFPLFHGGLSLRKISKKSKKIQSSKNAFNRFPKCPNMFWTSFGAMFLKLFLPSVPRSAFEVFWT